MRKTTVWRFIASLALASTASGSGFYTATDLGSLGGPTVPYGINSSGQVAGYSEVNGVLHGFLYTNGTMQDLGSLGGLQTVATSINVSGQVVGSSKLGNGFSHAFLYSGGSMIDLIPSNLDSGATAINNSGQVTGTTLGQAFLYSGGGLTLLPSLGGTETVGQGINNLGQIVGFSRLAGDTTVHAFLYSGGTMTDLGTLGGPHSIATAINGTGAVVGYSTPLGGSSYHAFLRANGVFIDLGTLGGPSSQASAINDSGQVVGQSEDNSGVRAFLYDQGVMNDLNSMVSLPATVLRSAYGINNAGQIIAFGANGHGYLLTPAPPPGPIVITSVTGPTGPVPIGSGAKISFTFNDAILVTDQCLISWGDGTTTGQSTYVNNCFDTWFYPTAGVYTVQVTVSAPDGRSATAQFQYVVVYDPNGGLVTGGGSYNSPPGALSGSSVSGKVTFGFVSRFQPGATTPSGNAELHFQAGALDFKSTSYQSLVVAGSTAQFKGTGTVHGSGNYDFMITAIDGAVTGGGGQDAIRVRISSPSGVLYDNMSGSDPQGSAAQPIDTGSIVIHK